MPCADVVARVVQTDACLLCPSNNSNSSIRSGNLTSCKCNPGYSGPDGRECQPCQRGTVKNFWGSGPCVLCAAGTLNNGTAQTVCEVCAANYFSNKSGSTACFACPISFYSAGNASNCSRCPEASTKADLPKGCPVLDDGGAMALAKAMAAAVSAAAAAAVAGAVVGGVAGGAGGGAGGGGGGGGGAIQLVEQVILWRTVVSKSATALWQLLSPVAQTSVNCETLHPSIICYPLAARAASVEPYL